MLLGDSTAAIQEGLHPAWIIARQMETLPAAFPSVHSTLDPEDVQLGQNCIQMAGGGAVLDTQVRSSRPFPAPLSMNEPLKSSGPPGMIFVRQIQLNS